MGPLLTAAGAACGVTDLRTLTYRLRADQQFLNSEGHAARNYTRASRLTDAGRTPIEHGCLFLRATPDRGQLTGPIANGQKDLAVGRRGHHAFLPQKEPA